MDTTLHMEITVDRYFSIILILDVAVFVIKMKIPSFAKSVDSKGRSNFLYKGYVLEAFRLIGTRTIEQSAIASILYCTLQISPLYGAHMH